MKGEKFGSSPVTELHGGLGVVVALLTPFPVEMNVKETSAISSLHLSAKQKARVRFS